MSNLQINEEQRDLLFSVAAYMLCSKNLETIKESLEACTDHAYKVPEKLLQDVLELQKELDSWRDTFKDKQEGE